MQIEDLQTIAPATEINADLVIIGGGPAGLTIAREFFGTRTQVIVLESGTLEESSQYAALNRLECVESPFTTEQTEKRRTFHGANAVFWSNERQPYGVRCRVLGGASVAWVGKAAAFDALDFETRPWVAYSGWPIVRADLDAYIDRAAARLNLGPNVYDDRFWDLFDGSPPEPRLDRTALASFFWQFARSRLDPMDLMRFGPEFVRERASNVRVLINSTAICIHTNREGTALEAVEASSLCGRRVTIRVKAAVLAAGGIENPRLMLASNDILPGGVGNSRDMVGRFLMDHPSARIATFGTPDIALIVRRFGFYGINREGRSHMYMHGLTPSRTWQEREGALNCALYFMEEHAPDDPWDAFKRLLRAKSRAPVSDAWAIAKCPGLFTKALLMRAFRSEHIPDRLKSLSVNLALRTYPNAVVREFMNRGLPHKLIGVSVDAISEQAPDPDNRITLSHRTDQFGMPLARVNWKIDSRVRHNLARLGQLIADEFPKTGLPAPILEGWITQDRPDDALIIDMGHTMGTTRMADDPSSGVVDRNCKVHGVGGLYVAGSSVFSTSGHANPTLMILALAIRLADHLKGALALQTAARLNVSSAVPAFSLGPSMVAHSVASKPKSEARRQYDSLAGSV